MNSNHVRVLYLEAESADAETVGALVGIVREVQNGKSAEQVEPQLEELRVRTSSPPPALPARKVRRPRQVKATNGKGHSRLPSGQGRASNAGATVIAALTKNPRPDFAKLSTAIYGNSDKKNITRARNVTTYLARSGKLRDNKDGTYTVVG